MTGTSFLVGNLVFGAGVLPARLTAQLLRPVSDMPTFEVASIKRSRTTERHHFGPQFPRSFVAETAGSIPL